MSSDTPSTTPRSPLNANPMEAKEQGKGSK